MSAQPIANLITDKLPLTPALARTLDPAALATCSMGTLLFYRLDQQMLQDVVAEPVPADGIHS